MIRKGLVIAVLLLALPVVGFAVTYELTDTSSDVPGTEYTLVVTDLGGGDYKGELSADTVVESGWYINWWDLQFDGSDPTADSMTVYPSSAWAGNFVDDSSSVDLENFNNFPQNKRIGAYTDGIVDDGSVDITGGAELDGSTYNWTFYFSLTNGLEPIAFQVGYYDGLAGGSSNILQTRLSQEFQVPEPETLLLLGSSLVGLGMLRRKVRA